MVSNKTKSKTPLQISEEIRAINQLPLKEEDNNDQAPKLLPKLTDKIEITKNDASLIIEMLCALTGYQMALHGSLSEYVSTMINKLTNLVNPK